MRTTDKMAKFDWESSRKKDTNYTQSYYLSPIYILLDNNIHRCLSVE